MVTTPNDGYSGPYTANGTDREYDYDFKVDDVSSIRIRLDYADGTSEIISSGFTVPDADLGTSSGTITYPVSPADPLDAGVKVTPYRQLPNEQPRALGTQKKFFAQVHENALDNLSEQIQDLARDVKVALTFPIGTDLNDYSSEFPLPQEDRALVGVLEDGELKYSASGPSVTEMASVAAVVTEIDALGNIITELLALYAIRAEIVTVEGSLADVVTVSGLDTEISTLAGIVTELTALYAIRANITTVAGIAANVTTVADLEAEINALEALSTELLALYSIRTNINTVAGIAANITTVAGIDTEVTAVAGIVTEIQAAYANLTAIQNASASATAAQNSADAAAANAASVHSVGYGSDHATYASDANNVGDLYYHTNGNIYRVDALNVTSLVGRWQGADGADGATGPQGEMTGSNNLSELTDTAAARSNLGLSNVNNTADADKPVSTPQSAALATKLSNTGGDITGRVNIKDNVNADKSFPLSIQNQSQQLWYLRALNTSNDFALHLNGSGDLLSLNSSGQLSATKMYPSNGIQLGGSGASNLLDDYEEGTWTPTASAGGGTFTLSDAVYTKIGREVMVYCTVVFTGGSGSLSIGGLPFTIAGSYGIGVGREDALNGYGVYCRGSVNQTSFIVNYSGASGNATPFQVANGTLRIKFFYTA
jgi:hypothetical protein